MEAGQRPNDGGLRRRRGLGQGSSPGVFVRFPTSKGEFRVAALSEIFQRITLGCRASSPPRAVVLFGFGCGGGDLRGRVFHVVVSRAVASGNWSVVGGSRILVVHVDRCWCHGSTTHFRCIMFTCSRGVSRQLNPLSSLM